MQRTVFASVLLKKQAKNVPLDTDSSEKLYKFTKTFRRKRLTLNFLLPKQTFLYTHTFKYILYIYIYIHIYMYVYMCICTYINITYSKLNIYIYIYI